MTNVVSLNEVKEAKAKDISIQIATLTVSQCSDESLGVDMDVNDTFDNEEVFESLMSAVIQYGVINGFVNEDDM